VHLAQCERQARPLIIIQPPRADPVRVKTPDRRQHTHRQLRAAHFHREHGDRQSNLDRHVLAHVQGKRRLAHRRPAGDDQQITRL